jgi:hypothetical protein
VVFPGEVDAVLGAPADPGVVHHPDLAELDAVQEGHQVVEVGQVVR